MTTVRTARNDAPPGGGDLSGAAPVTDPLAGPKETSAAPPSRDSADRSPWANSQFWILQLIILALYLIRLAATVAFHLNVDSQPVEFSTLALFLVPVVYATLNYAIEGALFTAGWVTLLAVARFFSARANHDNVAAWTELAQIILIDAVAIVIGQRVTAERNARRAAESAQALHLSAEARYRDLFYSNQAPILIVDANGCVIETNASAQRTFGVPTPLPDATPGRSHPLSVPDLSVPVRLVDMIGPTASSHILTTLISEQLPPVNGESRRTSDSARVDPVAFEVGGQPVLYRPTATMLEDSGDGARMQVVFEDVTMETRRHDLMEAFAARVVSGQEDERRHIAQELHDGPLQILIHLCRQIDEMNSYDEPTSDGAVKLSDLRSIVEGTVAELRSIAKGLRPSVLDDLGLVASINQILTEAGERHLFETSFGVTGPERRLPPTVELALFRIAQEAISNIERHAAAQHVAIGMSFEQEGLRLLVKDDGIGFDQVDSAGSSSDSLGLPGMTERAHLIGSRIVIHSEKGVGTTVDIWVPTTILDRN